MNAATWFDTVGKAWTRRIDDESGARRLVLVAWLIRSGATDWEAARIVRECRLEGDYWRGWDFAGQAFKLKAKNSVLAANAALQDLYQHGVAYTSAFAAIGVTS